MTEQQIKGLGFEMTKQYEHDQFTTRRYRKGVLEVEFTYEGDKLHTHDLTMKEINCQPVSFAELQALTHIVEYWNE